MSISRNRNGAVHIMFLIVAIIIAAAFAVLWFVQLQDNQDFETQNGQLRRQIAEANQRRQFAVRSYQILSEEIVGDVVPTDPPIPTDAMALRTTTADDAMQDFEDRAKRMLRDFVEEIGVTGDRPDTFQGLIKPAKTKITELQTKLNQKDLTINTLESQLSEKDTQLSTQRTTHQTERQQAQDQYTQRIDVLTARRTDLEQQNERIATRNKELTDELDAVQERANRERQEGLARYRDLQAQVNAVKAPLRIERKEEKPDGHVIAADPVSGSVFIDIGAEDLLRRGTRFKVYETAKGGVKVHKGWLRVIRLGRDQAEARVDELTGAGSIGRGDWVYNPYYSPGKTHHFVFLGQLPGRWTREMAERVLKERGAVIQDKVDVHTDFLVMGDPEDTDAPPLTQTDDYRQALTYGIEVIRARDLDPYLKF